MNYNSAKMVPVNAPTLQANDGKKWGSNQWVDEGKAIVQTMSGEDIAPCLIKRMEASTGTTQDAQIISVSYPITFGAQMSTPQTDVDLVQTLQAKNPTAVAQSVAYPMHGGMIGRQEQNGPSGSGFGEETDPSYTLTAGGQVRHGVAVAQPIPIDTMNHLGRGDTHSFGDFRVGAPSYRLTKGHSHAVATAMQVRRLTPVECERLQGFPDQYTNIPWRKKPESPDGPRYKALGNSMAVPVMAWIGKRIKQVSEL